ncbi:hypothetical protein [Naasia sp. SYSU D00057]|uniref:hypothetical protein n=1 Tax=Naasia sp. SYSU D00057 TaxID=2817380 RepID=UPI001B3173C4|nr:hypothetical protein [Naasia sp. SYSU D00057]
MKKTIGIAAGIAAALTLLTAAPATAATATSTIYVPDGFVSSLSGTRAAGHYEVEGTKLHIWTDEAETGYPQKVAEYVATDTPLSAADDAALDYTATSGGAPGFQLVVDLDGDGDKDGILVGEAAYNGDWWLADISASTPDLSTAPGPAHGYKHAGDLASWTKAFPDADVIAFGFSLGSGVLGDGVINSITLAGTTYTFGEHVVLAGKNECKAGGWANSTKPVFKNQGQCVSFFATAK